MVPLKTDTSWKEFVLEYCCLSSCLTTCFKLFKESNGRRFTCPFRYTLSVSICLAKQINWSDVLLELMTIVLLDTLTCGMGIDCVGWCVEKTVVTDGFDVNGVARIVVWLNGSLVVLAVVTNDKTKYFFVKYFIRYNNR